MEDWEVSHIDKNLPMLINNTRCTTLMKSLLRASGIITKEEAEILTALGDNHGPQREGNVLYDILRTRQGAYKALMSALEYTRQTGALDILKATQKYRNLETNKEIMVQKLMEIPVELFGSVQSLRQHIPCLQTEIVLELIDCENVKREIADVIKSNLTLKLTPELPQPHALYIPRAISNRLELHREIFKRTCPDIFVFKGIDPGALWDLVSPHVVRMSTTQLSKITCRHIHLDDDEDWDDLQLVANAPLHLVLKDTDEYILQRSTQVTSVLHEKWLDKRRKRDAYLLEDKFVAQFIVEQYGTGALVCDVPGMGKSWLMQSIARRIQLLCNRTVVFFIQLESFAKYLADPKASSKGMDSLFRVLQFVYDSKLAARFLSQYAKNCELQLVFVLDGFDEVSHVLIENITLFLKNLSANKCIRFIISSRPSMRAHLEETFNLISYDILPFGKQEQVAAMVNRWQETVVEGDNKKLSKFAAQCIDSFKLIRQKDRNDILGVPLQCYLLAVVNETSARQVCNPNRKKEFVVHETAKVDSVCELYTLFFNCLVLKGVTEQSGKMVEMFHTHKALQLLFPEIAPVFAKTFVTEATLEDLARKLGILCQSGESKLEFIHRSFAEFFAGKFFAEFWMDIKSYEPSLVKSIGSFFIERVMTPSGESEYPKEFIQFGISASQKFSIPKDVASFRFSTVLWFMNSFYRKENNNATEVFVQTFRSQHDQYDHPSIRMRLILSILRLKYKGFRIQRMYTLCQNIILEFSYMIIIGFVNHGFSSLLCLLVSLIKTFFQEEMLPLPMETSICKARLLCYIAAHGSPENASEVFDIFGYSSKNTLLKYCEDYPESLWTPLEVAVLRNDLDMVLFFNHKVKRIENRLMKVFLAGDRFANTDMKANMLIMEAVFGGPGKMFSCLSVQKFQVVDAYESLVNLMNLAWTCKCSLSHASLENKQSFLKLSLEAGTAETFIKLLLLLCPNKQNDGFYFSSGFAMDLAGDIIEHTGEAVLKNLNVDIIKIALPNNFGFLCLEINNVETIQMLIRIATNIASSTSFFGRNFLHDAVLLGKVVWVEHLIKAGYNINEKVKDGKTPLHDVDLRKSGAEMTQILLSNGADVNALNKYRQNFAHNVCRKIDNYWSKDDLQNVSKWVKYLLEAGYSEIWKMKDDEGNCPLDFVIKKLGKNHPLTQELLTLLQRQ